MDISGEMNFAELKTMRNINAREMEHAQSAAQISSIPVEVYCYEAEQLADHLENDAEKLLSLRIDGKKLAESIRQAAAALRRSEILFDRARIQMEYDEKHWMKLKSNAYQSRNDWLDFIGFACEENDDTHGLQVVDEIARNFSESNMVADIGKIISLLDEKKELMKLYGIDIHKRESMHKLYEQLITFIGNNPFDHKCSKIEKEMRDRAFKHLHKMVSRGRRAGMIVFNRNHNEKKRYRSEFEYHPFIKQ